MANTMDETRLINVVVHAVIPEFEMAYVRDAAGHQYALTRTTAGIDLNDLREGQRLSCLVTVDMPRILHARKLKL